MDKWVQKATFPQENDEGEDMSTGDLASPEQFILMNTFADERQSVALDGYRLHATNEPRKEEAFPLWQPLVDNAGMAGVMVYISSEFLKDALPDDGSPILLRLTRNDKPAEIHFQDPATGVHHYAALMPLLVPVDEYDNPITDLPWRPKDARS